jgi:hypothetical protein
MPCGRGPCGARILRDEIGADRKLMMDANPAWKVDEAVANMRRLAEFDPWWIEEPTSPDDILGHAAIRRRVAPIGVATGEDCHNRVMCRYKPPQLPGYSLEMRAESLDQFHFPQGAAWRA